MGNRGSWIWLSGGHPDTGSNEHKAFVLPSLLVPSGKCRVWTRWPQEPFSLNIALNPLKERPKPYSLHAVGLCVYARSKRSGKMSDVKEKGFS